MATATIRKPVMVVCAAAALALAAPMSAMAALDSGTGTGVGVGTGGTGAAAATGGDASNTSSNTATQSADNSADNSNTNVNDNSSTNTSSSTSAATATNNNAVSVGGGAAAPGVTAGVISPGTTVLPTATLGAFESPRVVRYNRYRTTRSLPFTGSPLTGVFFAGLASLFAGLLPFTRVGRRVLDRS